jgi:hypothetical protein
MCQFLMMISMKICSKMTSMMMMMISPIISTFFLNHMLIQISSWMINKKIQKMDDINVALVDEVHN